MALFGMLGKAFKSGVKKAGGPKGIARKSLEGLSSLRSPGMGRPSMEKGSKYGGMTKLGDKLKKRRLAGGMGFGGFGRKKPSSMDYNMDYDQD